MIDSNAYLIAMSILTAGCIVAFSVLLSVLSPVLGLFCLVVLIFTMNKKLKVGK